MIDSLTLKPVETRILPWMPKIGVFKDTPTINFKPGLNVLLGPNGCGKSSVLSALAMALAAHQGGESTVTDYWLSSIMEPLSKNPALGFTVAHDGQPILYSDSRATPGLIGGAFDDDFFDQGLRQTLSKGSSGERGLARLNGLLALLMGKAPGPTVAKFPEAIAWKTPRTGISKSQKARIATAEELLAPTIAAGPKTILLDEPESGFSLTWQNGIWSRILNNIDPEKFQVIVATHSPFALGLPNANYIEMAPGFKDEMSAVFQQLAARLN